MNGYNFAATNFRKKSKEFKKTYVCGQKKSLLMHFAVYANSHLTIDHLGNYFKPFSIPTINLAWQMSTNFPIVTAYKIPIYPTSYILLLSKDSCHLVSSASMQCLPTFVLVKTFQTALRSICRRSPSPMSYLYGWKQRLQTLSFFSFTLKKKKNCT